MFFRSGSVLSFGRFFRLFRLFGFGILIGFFGLRRLIGLFGFEERLGFGGFLRLCGFRGSFVLFEFAGFFILAGLTGFFSLVRFFRLFGIAKAFRPGGLVKAVRFVFSFRGFRDSLLFFRFHGLHVSPEPLRDQGFRRDLRLGVRGRSFRNSRRRRSLQFSVCPAPVPALGGNPCICILIVSIPLVQSSSSPLPTKFPTVYIIAESAFIHKSGCAGALPFI